jgi:hypothetical protein
MCLDTERQGARWNNTKRLPRHVTSGLWPECRLFDCHCAHFIRNAHLSVRMIQIDNLWTDGHKIRYCLYTTWDYPKILLLNFLREAITKLRMRILVIWDRQCPNGSYYGNSYYRGNRNRKRQYVLLRWSPWQQLIGWKCTLCNHGYHVTLVAMFAVTVTVYAAAVFAAVKSVSPENMATGRI